MHCKKCGRELSDTASFCPACGTPCTPKARSSGRKKLKVIIPAALVAGVLLISSPVWVSGIADAVSSSQEAGKTEEKEETVAAKASSVEKTEDVSYEELLKNLEQANTVIEDMVAEYDNADSDDSQKNLEQRVTLLGETQQTLDGLREEAAAFGIADDKLKSAVDAYYNAADSFVGIYHDSLDFIYRYIYNESLVTSRPDLFDTNRSRQENYDALNEWLETAKSEYANFEYPPYAEAFWKEYETILDLNQTILDKYALACNLNDALRSWSCAELFKRVDTMEEKWYQDMFEVCKTIMKSYGIRNRTLASGLYDEIQAYTAMSEGEKEKYTFENDRTGKMYVDTKCVDTIYPSLYNTYDSFAIITLATYGGQRSIDVEVEIPGFTQKYRQSYTITSNVKQLFIKPPLVTGDIDLSAAKSAQINVTLYEKDGTQITTQSNPVTIKSKNDVEWYSSDFGVFTQDNILCFLTPESSGISALKRSAIDEISVITNNQLEALVGYQETGFDHYTTTYLQAASIMRALYNEGVRYSMDSFSVSGSHQHVLLPDQVMEGRQGLCVETSLVVASALQSANMHAFLVFPPGHAQVAVEIWNDGEGYGEYFLIETTALSDDLNGDAFVNYANQLIAGNKNAKNDSCIQYYDADGWWSYIQGVEYVIDCNDSRILGMTPFSN